MSEQQATDIDARLARVEAQVDALTRALHLTLVAAQPTSKWLDAQMAKIDAEHTVSPPESSAR
jgi:hypothetical protein